MPEAFVYKPSARAIEDTQRAYQALKQSEDSNERFRAWGHPDAKREAKTAAMREEIERFAKAFELPLE